MNQQIFFIKYNGKPLDVDGLFLGQCVDVSKAYFTEVLGLPPFKGNAIDYFLTPPPGFKKISKGFFNSPNPGDLVIWNTNYNQYGHIGICNWSRGWDFQVFQQNDPEGSPCHFKEYSYKNVLGWLRPQPPIRIAFVGLENFQPILDKIKEFLPVRFEGVYKPADIKVSGGTLAGDDAVEQIERLGVRERFTFIFYESPTPGYAVTHFLPDRNMSFSTIPLGQPLTVPIHEFIHMLRKYLNSNHITYIEDTEKYPTSWVDIGNFDNPGWAFKEQYDEIKPFLSKINV